MGTLDSSSSSVKRKIKVIDLTGLSVTQIENAFNNNYGEKGWRIVQVIVGLAGKNWILAEKEE